MTPDEISDHDSLKAWLEGQTREVAVTIAHRAAMRVAPLFWRHVPPVTRTFDLTATVSARPLLIVGVLGTCPTPALRTAAAGAGAAGAAALAVASADAARAVRAVRAARAAVAVGADAARAAARVVAGAGAAARAVAAAADDAMLERLRADAKALEDAETGQPAAATPLWRDGENPVADDWHKVRTAWAATGDPGWRFWIDWYVAALAGRPLLGDWDRHWNLLTDIALIEPADWDAGPDTVNPLIAEILQRHAIAATENSERIEGGIGDFHVVPIQPQPVDPLKNALRRVSDVLDEFDKASVATDMFVSLRRQIDRLKKCCAERYSDAQGAFDDLAMVRLNVSKAKNSGELPQDDLIDDLEQVLDSGAIDILSSYGFVQETVSRRAAFRLRRDPSNLGAQYEADMLVIAAASREDLAQEFRDGLERLADENVSDEEKRGIVYEQISRGIRIARKGMKEVGEVAGDAAKIKRAADEVAPGWASIIMDLIQLVT